MVARLKGADEAKLRDLAGLPKVHAPASASAATGAARNAIPVTKYRGELAKERTLYEEVELCPGVTLRVRADADSEARRVADEIVRAYGA
jgi:hypothetical protein